MCDNTKGTKASRLHNRESNDLSLSVRSWDASAKSCAVSRCVNDSPTCITEPDKTIINYLICPVGCGKGPWIFLIVKREDPEPGPFFVQFPTAVSEAYLSFIFYATLFFFILYLCRFLLFLIMFSFSRFSFNELWCPKERVIDPSGIMFRSSKTILAVQLSTGYKIFIDHRIKKNYNKNANMM